MSDTALAAERIRELAGDRPAGEKLKAVFEDLYTILSRRFPKSQWTRRRVRSLWEAKAARVDYREIAEMDAIIAEAKKRHAAYIGRTLKRRADAEGLIATLELQDSEFHSEQIRGLRHFMGEVADPRDHQEGGDQ